MNGKMISPVVDKFLTDICGDYGIGKKAIEDPPSTHFNNTTGPEISANCATWSNASLSCRQNHLQR